MAIAKTFAVPVRCAPTPPPGRSNTAGEVTAGLYAAGNTMAAPSGTAYPGGGNPIGTSMLFSHLAVRDMLGRTS